MDKDNIKAYIQVLKNVKSLLKTGFFPGVNATKVAQGIGLIDNLVESAKQSLVEVKDAREEDKA